MNHLHIRGTRRRKREKGVENIFNEIMAENFPSLKKETDIKIQGSTEGHTQDEHKQ